MTTAQQNSLDNLNLNNITNFTKWVFDSQVIAHNEQVWINAAEPMETRSKVHAVADVQKIASGLRHENAGSPLNGAVVCVNAFNCTMYPIIFFGILAAGGCYTGANPSYTAHELKQHFQGTNTKVIITGLPQVNMVLVAARACNIPLERIFVVYQHWEHISANLRPLSDLMQHGQLQVERFNEARPHENTPPTPAVLMATSGTSGSPKYAARSHQALIEECVAVASTGLPKQKGTSILVAVPIFHAFAMPLVMMCAPRFGLETFLLPRFTLDKFLDAIRRFSVTQTAVAPPILGILLNAADQNAEAKAKVKTCLESLRRIWCGGAPLSAILQQRMEEEVLHPDAKIIQAWGMTECGWISSVPYPDANVPGSVGQILPGCEVKYVLGRDPVAPFETNEHVTEPERKAILTGELVVKSPWMMMGYVNNAEANNEAFSDDGWYFTGDIGSVTNGTVFLLDRAKDLIKARGWQVSPSELEGCILKHPEVIDCAVIGVVIGSVSLEEAPRVYVVRKDGSTLDALALREWMSHYLATYKHVHAEVEFVPSDFIPKNSAGKILRRVLKSKDPDAASR